MSHIRTTSNFEPSDVDPAILHVDVGNDNDRDGQMQLDESSIEYAFANQLTVSALDLSQNVNLTEKIGSKPNCEADRYQREINQQIPAPFNVNQRERCWTDKEKAKVDSQINISINVPFRLALQFI